MSTESCFAIPTAAPARFVSSSHPAEMLADGRSITATRPCSMTWTEIQLDAANRIVERSGPIGWAVRCDAALELGEPIADVDLRAARRRPGVGEDRQDAAWIAAPQQGQEAHRFQGGCGQLISAHEILLSIDVVLSSVRRGACCPTASPHRASPMSSSPKSAIGGTTSTNTLPSRPAKRTPSRAGRVARVLGRVSRRRSMRTSSRTACSRSSCTGSPTSTRAGIGGASCHPGTRVHEDRHCLSHQGARRVARPRRVRTGGGP